jgi:Na+-transporting NADH:ubiquinone oxidoreductase subunit C
MSNDSISKTLLVAFLLCLVCSVVVSTAAVVLKPAQEANKLLDKQKNILIAAGLSDGRGDIGKQFEQVKKRIVNIETGQFADDEVDADSYDQRQAQRDPKLSIRIPSDIDIASLKRRAKYAEVYVVNDEQGYLKTLILPISGYGLWSTLYGFIALEDDLNTIAGLAFYDHGETPGLGGEVDNPRWKNQWVGKRVFDDQGQVTARLKKGSVSPDNELEGRHFVDGLSGATLTSNGINNLLFFWLGEHGFGPFLDRIAESDRSDADEDYDLLSL